jgi:hypothetical protein
MTDVLKDCSTSTSCFKMLRTTHTVAQCQSQKTGIFRLPQAFVFSFMGLMYGAEVHSVLFVLKALGLLLQTQCASLSHFRSTDEQRGSWPPAWHSSSYNCFDTLLVVTLV